MLPCPTQTTHGPVRPAEPPRFVAKQKRLSDSTANSVHLWIVVFLALRVRERRACVAARCWVSPRTEPSGDLSRPLQQNRCRQTGKRKAGSLIATVDKSPDLRVNFKSLPRNQESSKRGSGLETECLCSVFGPIIAQ